MDLTDDIYGTSLRSELLRGSNRQINMVTYGNGVQVHSVGSHFEFSCQRSPHRFVPICCELSKRGSP